MANYGHLVVDECHHLSAVSFEAVARAAKAKYVLGLSATVTRKDGHHPIIFMQCGPIRYRVDARKQAAARPFSRQVVIKKTAFHAECQKADAPGSIQELYGLLASDAARNDMIVDDVLSALEAGRSPVVITERKEHLKAIADRLTKFAKNVIVLKGGMGAKQRNQVNEVLQSVPDGEERVIVATGRYLGEGFDDARLDTLFLTMQHILARNSRAICGPTAPASCRQAGGRHLRLRRWERAPVGQNGHQTRGWLPGPGIRSDQCW
jgi:superfamily II DNA or RNA helicase